MNTSTLWICSMLTRPTIVTWRERSESPRQTFSLEMRDARSHAELKRITEELKARIDSWRGSTFSTEQSALDADEPREGYPPGEASVMGAPLPAMISIGFAPLLAAIANSLNDSDWGAGPPRA